MLLSDKYARKSNNKDKDIIERYKRILEEQSAKYEWNRNKSDWDWLSTRFFEILTQNRCNRDNDEGWRRQTWISTGSENISVLLSPAFYWQNDWRENVRSLWWEKLVNVVIYRSHRWQRKEEGSRNLTPRKLKTKVRISLLCIDFGKKKKKKKTVRHFNKRWTETLRCKCKEKCKESVLRYNANLHMLISCFNLAGEDYSNEIRPRTWVWEKDIYLWHNKYERYSYPRVGQCHTVVAPASQFSPLLARSTTLEIFRIPSRWHEMIISIEIKETNIVYIQS